MFEGRAGGQRRNRAQIPAIEQTIHQRTAEQPRHDINAAGARLIVSLFD